MLVTWMPRETGSAGHTDAPREERDVGQARTPRVRRGLRRWHHVGPAGRSQEPEREAARERRARPPA